jgi:predicted anti-sigma-YlaC factor YlaD
MSACTAFEQDLVLYHYGECSGIEKQRVESHLESCAACRGFLQELKSFLPSTVETDEPPPSFWQDYSRELRIKLSDRQERSGGWWPSITALFRPWPVPVLAAGAIVAIGLTISLSNSRRPEPPSSPEYVEMATNADFFRSMDLLDSMDLLESVEGQEAQQKGDAPAQNL